MKNKRLTNFCVIVLLLISTNSVAAQQKNREQVIANFEGPKPVASNFTTHKAKASVVRDVPKGGGEFAMKTIVDNSADADTYFGTGFPIEKRDLSKASSIRLWIKTDLESQFNLQIHSEDNRVSVFTFRTGSADFEKWKLINAPVEKFTVPQWAKGKADWTDVTRVQVTAFNGGPYDGYYVALDSLVAEMSEIENDGPVGRGGPIILANKSPAPPKSPPPGFRPLFDGKTLKGWKPMARIPVPTYPGAEFKWELKGEALEKAKKNTGRWTVKDGAIVGGQAPLGSGKGAYLVSEETFGDFELIMDMKPDWKTDSGFLVRTLPGGSPGLQILVDHRPQGGIGGLYGNGLAGVHGMPFAIDAEYDKEGNPIRMIAAKPDSDRVELNEKTRGILNYAAEVEDFLKVWKFGQWNTIKVRCEGRIPKLTTWVNGMKIAVLDMSTAEWENYDAEACAKLQGRKGHISLEVHNTPSNHWLGKDRWWPGAVVHWKNIFIRELEPESRK